MKRLSYVIVLGGLLFSFISCNQNGQRRDHHDQVSATVTGDSLDLNNGAKWVVDSLTSDNFVDLKTMTDMFAVEPFPSVANYQKYGSDMGTGMNKMISECKMSGRGHDMLHLWFEPIIKQSNDLKTITDTVDAKKLFNSIHERVDLYKTYFTEQK
jgi:hypothetical protein